MLQENERYFIATEEMVEIHDIAARLLDIAFKAPPIVRQSFKDIAGIPIEEIKKVGVAGSFYRGIKDVIDDSHQLDIDVGVRVEESSLELAKEKRIEVENEADQRLKEVAGGITLPPIHILFDEGDWPADGAQWG